MTSTKEIEKTSKFLRKISSTHLGISVYSIDDQYNIKIGGAKKIVGSTGAAISLIAIGGLDGLGAIAGASTYTSFNPTLYNYYYNFATKSIYLNCLFDQSFEPLESEIPKNIFDKVNKFEENLDKEPKALNIFLYKKKVHYSFYDVIKTYKLYKFN